MKNYFLTLLAVFTLTYTKAASIDTILTHSESMNKNIKAVIISPASYSKHKHFPVLYLLHGYSNNYKSWADNCPELQTLADQYNILIVCPDGNFSSWYFDSPIDKSIRYETYVADELINWIDSHYKTIADRSGRAISGLSMGGHGAFYLALKHQDKFIAAGSMSGGLDFRPFPANWDIAKRLGSYSDQPELWERNTVINIIHLLSPITAPALIIDCGSGDFFYKGNVAVHEKLLYMNIPHEFVSRPGKHDWVYWRNAIKYQMLFFSTKLNTAN